jgi:hypothetical protein
MNIIDRLNKLAEVIADDNTAKRISQVAAFRVIAEYKNRIFRLGLDSAGNSIGVYSTNPFYVNPTTLIGVKASAVVPMGKYGNKVFKNGQPHKTKYLTDGYSELRNLTGRQNATVDLNFSGSVFQSVQVRQEGNDSYVSYTSQKSIDIMEGQEVRFGTDIMPPTEQEIADGQEAAQLELLAILEELD